jgi:hypothetical protein
MGAVKNICSKSGGAEENGKRGSKQDETQFAVWHKKRGSSEFDSPPPLKANVLFCIFFESHPVLDQTQGTGAVFSSLYRKL